MFSTINTTPYAAASAVVYDLEGFDLAVTAVKAAFAIPENGRVAAPPAETQVPVYPGDIYEGEPHNPSFRYPSDLIPGKAGTDVGLWGTVYSPSGNPVKTLSASVRAGSLFKEILVFGDRFWTKSLIRPGYTVSDPQPFSRMPLVWERAFGGRSRGPSGEVVAFMENPLGTGFVGKDHPLGGNRLPNFEDPENRIKTQGKTFSPVLFGFAPPFAAHRLPFAGTHDEAWAQNRRPLYPVDTDPRFFNCAPPGLAAQGFLTGGEKVTLTHLSPDGTRSFHLPRLDIRVTFHAGPTVEKKKTLLHTVAIEPDLNRFTLTFWASRRLSKKSATVDFIKIESHETSQDLQR